MALERLLQELTNSQAPMPSARLAYLSGLTAEERSLVGQSWQHIDVERRRQVVGRLVELAEDNPELDFDTVFRVSLDDEDAGVRAKAIEGLWECEGRWLVAVLVRLMASDPSEEVRASAAGALGRFTLMAELGKLRQADVEKIEAALLAVIDNQEESIQVRRRAVETVSHRSQERVTAIIQEAYASPHPKMRVSAILAMGRKCDSRWFPILIKELESAQSEMRFEAARACGELEDPQAVPYLVPLMDDTDLDVQLSAIDALGKIGSDSALRALRQRLKDPDEAIRQAVRDALEAAEANRDPFVIRMEG